MREIKYAIYKDIHQGKSDKGKMRFMEYSAKFCVDSKLILVEVNKLDSLD